jgi:hypothetical protein
MADLASIYTDYFDMWPYEPFTFQYVEEVDGWKYDPVPPESGRKKSDDQFAMKMFFKYLLKPALSQLAAEKGMGYKDYLETQGITKAYTNAMSEGDVEGLEKINKAIEMVYVSDSTGKEIDIIKFLRLFDGVNKFPNLNKNAFKIGAKNVQKSAQTALSAVNETSGMYVPPVEIDEDEIDEFFGDGDGDGESDYNVKTDSENGKMINIAIYAVIGVILIMFYLKK